MSFFPLCVLLSLVPDGLYTYMGSDEPDVPGNDGRPNNNVFDSNTIADAEVGVRIKEGDSNTFTSEIATTDRRTDCTSRSRDCDLNASQH